ncbi:hypothetical protein MBANPS3_006839 [Mucor bainieri]
MGTCTEHRNFVALANNGMEMPPDELFNNGLYEDRSEIVNALTLWASKRFIQLVSGKSYKNKRVLHCKFDGESEAKPLENRSRNKTSYLYQIRMHCSKSTGFKWKWTGQKEAMSKHNHSTDAETFKLLPAEKRAMLSEETVLLVHRMIEAGNSVTEIMKTLGGQDGVSILTYDDIRNWINEFNYEVAPGITSTSKGQTLLDAVEASGHYTAFQQVEGGSNAKSIFFMHPKAQSRPHYASTTPESYQAR